MYPESIHNLIESFKLLPGIGERTAERLAFSILDMDYDNVKFFSDNIKNVQKVIHKCSNCNNLTESEICNICSDSYRDKKTLCVIEDVKSIYLFEKMGMFKGIYHVLDGLISPLDGINPEDIGLEKLLHRVKNENYQEIIFAFKPSVEGETTALYIKKMLENTNIKITRLASGVPMGADIEYIDSLTLERALNDRKEVE